MNHSLISNCNSLSFLANEPSRNLGPNYTSSRIEFTMYFHFTLLSDNNKNDRPKPQAYQKYKSIHKIWINMESIFIYLFYFLALWLKVQIFIQSKVRRPTINAGIQPANSGCFRDLIEKVGIKISTSTGRYANLVNNYQINAVFKDFLLLWEKIIF